MQISNAGGAKMIVTGTAVKLEPRLGRCAVALLTVALLSPAAPGQEIKRFPAAAASGVARAVRVDDASLAHTAMMLGWDESGAVKGDARAQAVQALKNVDAALAVVGSSLGQTVKLHFYVSRDEDTSGTEAALAQIFADRPVAAAWVTTTLTDPAALVGVDAVALAPVKGTAVQVASAPKLPAALVGGHVAVLPAGRRIYVSGQAEGEKELRDATKKTMASLGKTLAWLKATKADVVQVKAFVRPFSDFRAVVEEVVAFFTGMSAPTCVFVEWSNASQPAEIEMIVAGGPTGEKTPDGVAFLTPPGLPPSPRFARIAVVDPDHPLIFISGLYAETTGSGRREWLEIFGQLSDILWETGSSMRHQVKGTYYSSTSESRRLHGEIRDVFFDPARPPASSGMMARGTGRAGKTSTIDMIAIPVPRAKP
jgi:enamine deaminase RidA (YjgF/YER057c/UK114 family)